MLPLHGLRVLDVTTFLAGPLATRTLADLGAEVLKVEPPGGDPTRGGWTGEGNPSFYWRALHGGRRSVVIDLAAEEGRANLLRLAGQADVVVDNLRPGVTTRFGVDGPALRELFPRLVTCAITGFDADDELAGSSATDGPVQAWTGAVELMEGWIGTAMAMPLQVGDVAGGMAAAQGILAALVARGQTGVGSHVEVSLTGSLNQWMSVTDRMGTLASPATLVLTAQDGGRFLVQAPMHFAARLLQALGLPADTPRTQIAAAAQTAVQGDSAAGWLARLRAVGIPAALVRPPARELPRPPWSFDGQRTPAAGPPPALGADNARGWA